MQSRVSWPSACLITFRQLGHRPTRPPRTKGQRLGTADDILCRCRHRMETVMYPIHCQIGKARLAGWHA
jgi:hypothetical protein